MTANVVCPIDLPEDNVCDFVKAMSSQKYILLVLFRVRRFQSYLRNADVDKFHLNFLFSLSSPYACFVYLFYNFYVYIEQQNTNLINVNDAITLLIQACCLKSI